MIKRYTFITILALLGYIPTFPLQAETPPQATQEKENLSIEANQVEIHSREGKSIYRGDVKFTYGIHRLTGDLLTLVISEGTLSSAEIQGSPAHYQRSASARNQEPLSAQAQRIEYQEKNQMLTLGGQAKLTQNSNTFSGNRIEYNLATGIVRAGETSSQPGRVYMTLTPKSKLATPPK